MSNSEYREAQQQARAPKWWYVPHYNFCCRSLWCVLDTITQCRYKPICDRHDRSITGGWPTDAE